ncbi:signal recognition particle receptor beta subunit-domain-containing protein [Collybia nuda]|uniref:Signal recognition particle receptor subunit beta n=1 Tax=Collybia nuda TaxID=64659 RepID=A0A9P5YIU7_9AGAR|nr:signal recognition particle receptor beta subunit-domain-containing protein [Collybia nuda]
MLTPQTSKIAALSLLVAILALTALVIFNKRRTKSRGNVVLLLGAPDSGKTTILSTLHYGQALQTHTSLQMNVSLVSLSDKKTIRIVDIPGHPRVRDQFREHLDDAKAIVFAVDSSTISRTGPAVAEHLHNILHTITSLPPSQTLPSLAVLAHKSDLLRATSPSHSASKELAINRVKTILERELEKRRVSQSGGVGVEGLGAEGERAELGGLECNGDAGATFKFDDWEGGEVTFIGSSVSLEKSNQDTEKAEEDGLLSLREWLDDTM